MKLSSKSFTLVEVLLVSSLMAVLGVAVFQAFNNGFKLWGKAQLLNREAEVGIFLDKLGEDLRSMTNTSGISFKGRETELAFQAIIITEADPNSSRSKEESIDQIGAVEYRFDAGEHMIYRRQVNYAGAIKGKWLDQGLPVAAGIDSLDLHYQVPVDKALVLKSIIDEGVPLGVVVDISYSDDSGEHQLKRYLSILIGN